MKWKKTNKSLPKGPFNVLLRLIGTEGEGAEEPFIGCLTFADAHGTTFELDEVHWLELPEEVEE